MNVPTALRQNAGFSMIELVTALVLTGIVLSLTVPRMDGFINRQKTRRSLDVVAGDVAFARLQAVQNGQRVWMRFNPNGSYDVARLNAAGDTTVIKQVNLRSDYPAITLSGVSRLEFSSRGLVTTTSGDAEAFIKVAGASHRDSIFVSPAGRVYRAY